MEDILALLASRPTIAEEVASAPFELRNYLAGQARAFLKDPDAEDLLAAHLNNAQDSAKTMLEVKTLLGRLTLE